MELARKQDSWKGFNQIAKTYDLLNRLTSFGIDTMWRKALAKSLPTNGPLEVLDLATGTGDVAIELIQSCWQVKQVVGVDPAIEMVREGKRKVKALGLENELHLEVGNALNIPFADASFDVVTMAFGIRNVPDVPKALGEIYRVLRPGGRALILELSLPSNRLIRSGFLFYFRHVLPFIGGLISGEKKAYVYLNQSVEAFPHGKNFLALMAPAGFKELKCQTLSAGVASIYGGVKL